MSKDHQGEAQTFQPLSVEKLNEIDIRMAELARQAALVLAYEHEIFVELLVPNQLSPFELGPLLGSVNRTGRLLVIEEGSLRLGWGAEVLAQATEALGPRLECAKRIGAQDLPVPASSSWAPFHP